MNKGYVTTRMYQLNKTQESVADEIGISRKHMNRIINNDANPRLSVVEDIARALECEVADLFKKEG